MGFEIGGQTALLIFEEGTSLAGAEVRVSLDMSVRDFLALQRAVSGISQATLGDDQIEALEGAFETFGRLALKSWNLERDGEPIPATGEGMLMLPFKAANEVFAAWGSAISDVSPNLSAVSANGASAEAEPVATAA